MAANSGNILFVFGGASQASDYHVTTIYRGLIGVWQFKLHSLMIIFLFVSVFFFMNNI